MRALAAGPAHRHCGGAPGLWPADPVHSDDRGRAIRSRTPPGLEAAERALKLAERRGAGRSGAGAAVRRRVGQLDRAGRRAHARRQAGGDAGAAALRRQHRRDQHGAQASLAHQGRPARARAQPARVVTLAISDVPGDDPAVIGSGPTVPDPTTLADARAIVARFQLDLPGRRDARARRSRATRRPKPGDAAFAATEFKLIARPADAFRAAEQAVRAAGYECVMLGDRIEGEAREVAAEHAGAGAGAATARPPRRHPVRRRIDRHHPRPGPRRPEPGICAGAGHRAAGRAGHRGAGRRYRRHRRRRRLPGRPGRRRRSTPTTLARARCARPRSGRIFSPTTIPPGFSPGSATSSRPVRPGPT